MNMHSFLSFFFSILSLLAITCIPLDASENLASIAAIVNHEIITEGELDEQFQLFMLSGIIRPEDSLRLDSLRLELLAELINRRILIEYAQQESIEVLPEEIEEMLDNAIEDITARFPSEEAFMAHLKEEGLTLELFREYYEKQIAENLLLQKLMQKEFGSEMFVSEKEINDFYTTNRDSFAEPAKVELAHILLIPKPSKSEEARVKAKIEEVLLRFEFNEDFAQIARKFSEGPYRNKGGDRGFVKREDLSPDIVDAAFSLGIDEMTLAHGIKGFYLFECVGKREDMVHLKQIFFKVNIGSLDTLRTFNFAKDLKKRAESGEDFSKLVQRYSDDIETKERDGSLGEVYLDQLDPLFRDAVQDLGVAEVSEPIKTEFGFHLFKVLAKPEPKIPELEEIENLVREFIIQKRTKEKTKELLERILPDFYVENFLESAQP
jgi:peptidyl-prolyl cis-trans isomerase SurA